MRSDSKKRLDSRQHDPGPIPEQSGSSSGPIDGAIEISRAVMDRFYRRRLLAWTVWLGFWAIPGAALARLSSDSRFLLPTADWVAIPVVIASLGLYWGLCVWATETAKSHRRDHAQGHWLSYRIYDRLGLRGPLEADVAKNAGHWRVTLDIWVPFAITSLIVWGAVGGTVVRILQ